MDTKSFCRNCLSSNIPLLEMSQETFVHNNDQINFIEVYWSCTGVDVKPFEAKICEICCKQLTAIYKFRNKKVETSHRVNLEVNPIDPDPDNEIIPKTEIKIEDVVEHVEDVFVNVVQPPDQEATAAVKAKRKRQPYVKTHFCPHCSKGFLSPSALEKHILPVHKGVKLELKRPYLCADCGKAFPSPAKLKTHSSGRTIDFRSTPSL
jgi:hypothetical protein